MIILTFFMCMCLVSLQSISAANLTVHPGESIQNVVNTASDGDNIIVYDNNNNAYTYKESITLNKKVYIKSSGKVTIEAKNTSSAVFVVNGNGAGSSIQNFTLSKSNYCIMINNANNCLISGNNIISASLVGIQFYGDMSNSRVVGNTITGVSPNVGNGISFEYGKCTYNNITDNTISNFLNGIIFNDNSENNIVSNNHVTCTGYQGVGIYATDNSRNMQITSNTVTGAEDGIAVQQIGTYTPTNYNISGNTVTGNKNGFWVCLSNSTISNNIATQNTVSGLDITGKYNNILDNTASYNGNCGITLSKYSSSDGNNVSGNTLNYNLAGLNTASNNSTISNNEISYNTNNGLISTADHNIIDSNTIKNNAGSGILLIGSFNTVSYNILQNNLIGICLQKSSNADNNSIIGNDASYNENGINSASPYSNFTNNKINNNNVTGLTITESGCIVTGNSMCNNGESGLTITSTGNSVIGNRLENNLYGASFSNYNAANFNLNSVVGNTYQVYSPDTTGYLNALNNWWGSNSAPARIYGLFNVNPWIVLRVSGNPSQIYTGTNSTITADLNHNSNGVDVTTLYSGKTVPDGITVNFNCDSLGSVYPNNSTFTDGIATTSFTGNSPGVSVVGATVNSQNVTSNVSIVSPAAIPTAITVNPTTGYKGVQTNLSAALRDTQNNVPLSGKTIVFSVNGTLLGTAITNSSGVATLPYTVLENIGVYNILASFIQDVTYAASNGTGNLTVVANIADISVTNIVSNSAPKNNDTITLTVTVKNNGPCPAQNVTVSEWTSNGLTYISDDSNGALNLNNGIWTIGTLQSGQTATLTITAKVSATTGTITNTATYNPVTNDPNSTNNNQTATMTLTANNADIQVTNTASNTTPKTNDTITLTVTVKNNGPDTAQNVTISEWTSNGLTYISDNSNGALNLNNGIWTIGTLQSGQTATLTITAKVSATTGTITNTATYNPVTNDPNSTNNNQTATMTLTANNADIQVTNTASNTTPKTNDTITLTVTVKNNGPDTAQNVTISEWTSNGLTYISDNSNGALNLNNGIWTIGTLQSGQTATLTITAKVSATTGTITNTATYNPVTNDPNSTNNNQTATMTLTANNADIQVTNTASNTTPKTNDTITLTVTVKNNGPDTAQNVTISEWTSNGLTYISDNSNGALNLNNGIWTIGTLQSGQTATLTITAKVSATTGTITNTATYNPVTNDPNSTNNNQTATMTLTANNADIQVTNTASNTTPKTNDTITLTVTVKNNGPDTAQNVTISEWTSNGLTYISDNSNGALNLNNGIWTIGTLQSGQTATLTITAKVSATTGTITNTATYNPVTNDPNSTNNNQTATITVT